MVFAVLQDELTPLLLAINEHRHQMAKFLIKKNANIHAVDRFKRTSLMLAVNDSSTDLVKLLLQEGVNVLAEDKNGSTAEEHAFKTGLTFNYRLIRDYKVEEICKQLSQNSNQDISQTDTDLQDSTEELSRNKNSIADSLNLYPRLKRKVEVTDFVSNKEVGMEATRTSRSGHEISEEGSVSR
ncbi:POTE ankyrin domain family member H-like [Pteropus medius]|uniref:POTE ankyrin domain family member H-like n=1 Tax=Pteropus vampyrus TaxID=132908 RepID=UPI00196A945B|nr:POTE ankyrin domain family member H-like [Pteropus giganteus]